MPRQKKDQASMFDRTIEDPALEAMLEQQLELEPEAKSYRAVKKGIRKHVEEHHTGLVADSEGGDANGWVRCGRFRFRPRATERDEGEVKIGAGINWSCPVERI